MLLKKGDNNEDVKKLQIKLGVDPVGNFGPKTEEAVKAWQRANGLLDDGIVGDGTWNKMFGITPAPAASPAPATILVSPFKLDKLKGHIPDSVIAAIPDTAAKFNITNVLRLAHFLAQAGHESGQFKSTSENLNYSSKGLLGIFPRYFTPALAESYARQPQKIANRVYASRMGNGDEKSGDGWKFRGRGALQLTGKDNYTAFAQYLQKPEIMTTPELVATTYSFESAMFFFDRNKLWSICDLGINDAAIEKLTRKINGGTHGLEDRNQKTKKYYEYVK